MALTEIEKKHVIRLAEGTIQPETGMEKHFVNVCQGQGKACTPKEKEWFAYWKEYSSEMSPPKNSSQKMPPSEHYSSKNVHNSSTEHINKSSEISEKTGYFTQYWDNSTWEDTAIFLQSTQNTILNHSASNLFRKRGVKPGDYVYIVTVMSGLLYLGTRIFVEKLLNKQEAEQYLNYRYELWDAKDHIVMPSEQAMKFNHKRVVPPHITEKLRILAPNGQTLFPQFKKSGELDESLFRGVKRLTAESAKFLDSLFEDEMDRNTEEEQFSEETEKPSHSSPFSEKDFLIICILATFAKADGIITKEEIQNIDTIITEILELEGEARRTAIQIFGEAKKDPSAFTEFITQYHDMVEGDEDILVAMLEMLFMIATSSETLHAQHEQLLITAVNIFQFPHTFYQHMKDHFFPERYYTILGCSQFDSDEVIKSQYKKLAKDFHPDRIVSKDLAPAFIDFAKQKFQEIQEAYEFVKQIRGF